MKKLITILFILLSINTMAQLQATSTHALISINLTNFDMKPLIGDTVFFEDAVNNKSYYCVSDNNGKSEILVPKGTEFFIKYKAFFNKTDYSSIKIPNEEGLISFEVEIKIDPPKVFTLDNVFFDTGKSILKSESYTELNELYQMLKTKKDINILIAGHTDNEGDEISNQLLSENRAKACYQYLISKGIEPSRLSYKGFGETKPISDNNTEQGKAKNRRVEIRILN